MSYIDIGKGAKHKGATHPKNVPTPSDKPTPKARPKLKADKPFGYIYEYSFGYRHDRPRKWVATRRWFKTAAHRDQTYEKEAKSQASWGVNGSIQYRGMRKVER